MSRFPKIVTYNVNGIGESKKRRLIFNHLHHINADIIMLQETHSSIKTEKMWKAEWGGHMFCNHGTLAARGVAILIKRRFAMKVLRTVKDQCGRVLAVYISINGKEYTVASIYAPNEDNVDFFIEAFRLVESLNNDLKILAGDFNTVLNLDLDLSGGKGCSNSKTRVFINEFMQLNDMVDPWRCLHPDTFRSTFIRRKPTLLLERLDYIIVSSALLQNVIVADIPPAYLSDHAAPEILLSFTAARPGKGYWKLNTSLLHDEKLNEQILDIFREVFSTHSKSQICTAWELVKMKVRERAIARGIEIANSTKNKEQALNNKLKTLVEQRDNAGAASRVLFENYDSAITAVWQRLKTIGWLVP